MGRQLFSLRNNGAGLDNFKWADGVAPFESEAQESFNEWADAAFLLFPGGWMVEV